MANCTICLEPLLSDLEAAKCGHVFHGHCIHRWISTNKKCPNCNKKLTKRNLLKIYLSPSDNEALKVIQEENETLNEQLRIIKIQNTQIDQKLKHQLQTTQSYIQKNIEIDEKCDELQNILNNKNIEIIQLKEQLNKYKNNDDDDDDLIDFHGVDDDDIDISSISLNDTSNNNNNNNNILHEILDLSEIIILNNNKKNTRKRTRAQYLELSESDDDDDDDDDDDYQPNVRTKRRRRG